LSLAEGEPRRLEFQPIDSCDDLVRFMAELVEDLRGGEWEHLTLTGYLGAIARWLADMCEHSGSPPDEHWTAAWEGFGEVPPYVPEGVPWHFIARMLAAPASFE
jgi:hypothetical protein